jgi:hypothetical protein
MSANRVEKLVYWYLRFNGYLTVENFTVHPDHKKEPEAEVDILAVRFLNSKEEPEGYRFARDDKLILPNVTDFIIGEVKSSMCAINENSWGDPKRKHIEYALEWMGFLPKNPKVISTVAEELYQNKIWSEGSYSVRFMCFGNRENEELSKAYPQVKQILLPHMMEFVRRRLTTGCNALHRENWDSYIREVARLIENHANPEMLLDWTLQKDD